MRHLSAVRYLRVFLVGALMMCALIAPLPTHAADWQETTSTTQPVHHGFFGGIVAWFTGLFSSHAASQPAAAAAAIQTPIPSNVAIPSDPFAQPAQQEQTMATSTTIVHNNTYITQPIRERVVQTQTTEMVPMQAPAGVSSETLNASINQLRGEISSQFASVPSLQMVAQGQRINNLSSVTVSNATVNGVTGLTDADIPNDVTASNYLLLAGGTITGTLSVSTLLASSTIYTNLVVTNATSTNFFSTTASSTNLFASSAQLGSLTILTSSFHGGLATLASGFVSQASSTVVGNLTSTGVGSFLTGNFTGSTGTTTIANGQGFTIGGSQLVLQQGSGNVGIGTSNPTQLLTVAGTARFGVAGTSFALSPTILAYSESAANGDAKIAIEKAFSSTSGNPTLDLLDRLNGGDWRVMVDSDNIGSASAFKILGLGTATSSAPFTITTNGNVGVGTSTPYSRLEVWGTDTASTTIFSAVNSASTTVFAVFGNGNSTYSGSIFQSSDQRLKSSVVSLDASSSLASVNALDPVSYNRLDQPEDGQNLGFIAQAVQKVFPSLVSTTSATTLTPGGTLTVNYVGLIAPLVKAVQEVSARITSLTSLVAGFADHFTTREFTSTNVTANTATFGTVCAKKSDGLSVCVTGDQLSSLLAASNISGSSGGGSSGGSAPDTAPPVISMNGLATSNLAVGDVYSDLGASATDDVDHNVGLRFYVNGLEMQTITVDTSIPATFSIDYVATDSSGNTATSTRTVIVQ